MKKTYNLTMHTTPQLRVFIGISSRQTWRYEGHWRGSALEKECCKFGWGKISHTLVEQGLSKKQALQMRRELVQAAGESSLNRVFGNGEEHPKKRTDMKEKQTTLMAGIANGVKLSLTFDNRHLGANGYPVVVRVYKDREWAYVPTGFNMTAQQFKSCSKQELTSLEKKYNAVRDWCMKAVDDGVFSVSAARKCLKEKKEADTLEGLIRLKASTLSNAGTIHNYESTIKQVKKVFADGLELKDVCPESIKKFISSLKNQGLSDTTANIYLSTIKASMNYGIYKQVFDENRYPFKKNAWECDKITLPKSAKRTDRWLSKEDMQGIWSQFIESGNKWIGLFLFSYLAGGMNLADMVGLKFDKQWTKNRVICWTRKKTQHRGCGQTQVPVSSWVEKLLARLGIEEKEGESVFKFLDGDEDKSRRSASVCTYKTLNKIGDGVSMTYARHSFATVSTRLGMPDIMRENAMGHNISGVQSHYIASFRPDEMREWFEKLL